ncbi:hypothetical protein I2485_14705 [Nesterenkonia sp. E16_7]|uniref:type II secretion system F family protein n=1 Tax=unclassified Nesterenkonia TaxID=2629769 RepID=UPI001A91BCB2|nr:MULTISPECIES: hypothetical protein [unclassified Nesterenkonia]MBO0597009.1 hypothetical protein [Nesterenkonia sp. E16_10]MBO0599898.1 hypothetical protein [Nesterenkonia sp. E16_7]
MTDPAQLPLLSLLSGAMIVAGLLGITPRRADSSGPRRLRPLRAGLLIGWLRLRELPRRWRSGSGGEVNDLRGSAASLLHQYAALLQSGRSQAQAWVDLSAHWRSREDHALLGQVCERAASAEQAGLGAVVGLRRSLAEVAAAHRPRAGSVGLHRAVTESRIAADPVASPALGPARYVAPGADAHPGPGADAHPGSGAHAHAGPGPGPGPGLSVGASAVLTEVLQGLISIHALSQSTGAPLSRLCRKAADSLEDSAALDAAVRTAAAGPRLTQFILAALPLGGLAMGALMGAQPLAVLFGSTLGWGCLVSGLGCLLLGWRWSARMIRAVTPHG